MKPLQRLLPLAIALGLIPSASQAQADSVLVRRLIQLNERERVAHVTGDADLLAGPSAPGFIEVNRGRVSRPSPEAQRSRFAAYFQSVRFLEWEDVRPPVVRISPDSRWAEIIVEKRVRTIPAPGQGGEEAAERYAWTERWMRSESTWRLAAITSTDRPDTAGPTPGATLAERTAAYEILRRARIALGGERNVAEISSIWFTADCQGPRSRYQTTVASSRDGRVRFEQVFPDRPAFRAGVNREGSWQQTGEGRPDTASAATRTVVFGHELMLLALAPESRYRSPRARPDEQFDGRAVKVVRFFDELDAPVDFLYDAASGMPVAYRPVNNSGTGGREIVARWSAWRRVNGVMLPFDVVMTQGSDTYHFQVTSASTDWLRDATFLP